MRAVDLDVDLDCWVCGGSGEDPVQKDGRPTEDCRFCDGTGGANHYGPEHPGPQGQDDLGDRVIMAAWVHPKNGGLYVDEMTVDHPEFPAFDQRFGPSTNADDGPGGAKAEYHADTLDQLSNNPLGTGGPYEVNAREVRDEHLPGGSWPTDGDLSIEQAAAWQRARGDDGMAACLETIQERLGI